MSERRPCSSPTPRSASSAAASSAACWRWPRRGSASSATSLRPSRDSPAFDVVHRVTCADYTDTEALDRFAGDVDVVTYEFENVPAETATFLAARVPVLPDPQVLATTQDRLIEKTFVAGLGIRTAALPPSTSRPTLAAALEQDRPAGRAEDAPLRLRRQGPGHDPERHRSARRLGARSAASRASSKPSCRSSARFGHRRARP